MVIALLIINLFLELQKGTKNALETGRTFATLFADMDLRQRLLMARTEEDFKRLLWEHTKELAEEQSNTERKNSDDKVSNFEEDTVSIHARLLFVSVCINHVCTICQIVFILENVI